MFFSTHNKIDVESRMFFLLLSFMVYKFDMMPFLVAYS